jgi:hypothetical protein
VIVFPEPTGLNSDRNVLAATTPGTSVMALV